MRMVAYVDGLDPTRARVVAIRAVDLARVVAPKMSGQSSRRFAPIFDEGVYGISWMDPYVYFQEVGTRPFTMRNLAGKTIPMWVNDPTGEEYAKNPKAKRRTTADGRVQVLIFRHASHPGERKLRSEPPPPRMVPRSWPGAPGRINKRHSATGQILPTNVGVRWRHPGLDARNFLHRGIEAAGEEFNLTIIDIEALDQIEGKIAARVRA